MRNLYSEDIYNVDRYFRIIILRWIINVVFVNNNYLAENPTLFIVRDRGEDIQHGGVGPALVNLENKEISREDILVVSLTAHTL